MSGLESVPHQKRNLIYSEKFCYPPSVIGIQQHVVEKLLDHRSGIISGVAAIYNLHRYEAEVRSAVDAWATRLEEIVNK